MKMSKGPIKLNKGINAMFPVLFTLGWLTLAPNASALLIQSADVSKIEFEGVAKALQEKTWVESWREKRVMSFEETQSFHRLLADTQREWISQEQSSIGSRDWPRAQALFDFVTSRYVENSNRSDVAFAFFRIAKRMAESAKLADGAALWLGRAISIEPGLRGKAEQLGKTNGVSVPYVQIDKSTVQKWLTDWDEVWIDGTQITEPSEIRMTEDQHWAEFVSNRYRTVQSSINAIELKSDEITKEPWVRNECKNGLSANLDEGDLKANSSQSVFLSFYRDKKITLVGPAMCLMALGPMESQKPMRASGTLTGSLSSDGELIRKFGATTSNDPLTAPREVLSSRTLWIGAGVAVLAVGLYAAFRAQNQNSVTPAHSEGF